MLRVGFRFFVMNEFDGRDLRAILTHSQFCFADNSVHLIIF